MNEIFKRFVACALFGAALVATSTGWAQQPAPADLEKRTPVVLRPNEKAAMLADMRDYLKGLQEIFAALARDEMDKVAVRAESLGKIRIFQTYLNFPTASAVKFRELAALVHEDFDDIAADARTSRNAKATLEKLSITMKRCVSCHDSYYLTDKIPAR